VSGLGELCGGATSIDAPDEEVPLANPLRQEHRTVMVLYIGTAEQQFERTTNIVAHGLPLAAYDLLVFVITVRSTFLGGTSVVLKRWL